MNAIESSPLSVFTILVAPALLTNASSLLALGTSNRLARAIDRSRALALILKNRPRHARESRDEVLAAAQYERATWRALMLTRALRSLYTAVGFFAGSLGLALTLAALQKADLSPPGSLPGVLPVLLGVTGIVMLGRFALLVIRESLVTSELLEEEGRLLVVPSEPVVYPVPSKPSARTPAARLRSSLYRRLVRAWAGGTINSEEKQHQHRHPAMMR